MNFGKKLIIFGIVLLFYWVTVSYAHDTTLESLFAQSSDSNPVAEPFEYPLWWPLTIIQNYAGMAGFILLVVGVVKTYMIWRLDRK